MPDKLREFPKRLSGLLFKGDECAHIFRLKEVRESAAFNVATYEYDLGTVKLTLWNLQARVDYGLLEVVVERA